jgi:radical SAM superfamily enzyme YgiQ (UPF0313 family)
MPKVILVNPAHYTVGYSFFTPRWLFVLAQATPADMIGKPILVDESIERFDPDIVEPGDIVGIGISSGNCLPGYRVLREAKLRDATVIMGGVHPTIFPEEPLEIGADSVVTGNGDLVWSRVVGDALDRRLRRRYDGGRVAGDEMVKARWDLLDPTKYLFATIQTVAGCPENCSFCSVWVTDGRRPRMRMADKVIEEANELYSVGFRQIAFADDNFGPSTLARIAREPSLQKRREFERIREERLRFFEDYGRRVPADLRSMAQATWEVVSDEEYLAAMYRDMRMRAMLIGVESFTEDALASVNKKWNATGARMIEAIRKIQDHRMIVLTSIITGLESDTIESLAATRDFATASGALLAQFTFYSPYPGTKDYHEMMADRRRRGDPSHSPKHRIEILEERYWLTQKTAVEVVRHPALSSGEWKAENRKSWDAFYSLRETIRRVRSAPARAWPLAGKLTYVVACLAFKRFYSGYGVSADGVNRRRISGLTRFLVRLGVGIFNRFFRHRQMPLRV